MQKLLTTTLCLFILSCTSSKKNVTPTVPAFKKSPLDSAYTIIRPAIQTFTIDNTKTTTIKAARGTEILIPAGCFVTASGEKVANAQLEVVEAFSMPEFVSAGLATLSNGQVLMSNGMAYINAKAGDEELQLKEGASLTVSMPTMGSNQGFQLFTGDGSNQGFQLFTGDGSNWTVDSSMLETDYIVPLPLDLLYPRGNKFFWYCITGVNTDEYHILDTNIVTVTNKKYENTIIATEEFQKRYAALMYTMYNMSYFLSPNYLFPNWECKDQTFNYDIWKVYFEHPTRPFRESDSIAKKIFTDYFNTNKDKIAAYYKQANKKAREVYDDWTDTNYIVDLRNTTLEAYFMDPLKHFPPSNNAQLKFIDDHGVNLDAPNAHEQLAAKGVSDKEINDIMSYHFRRQQKISQLKREKDALVNKDKVLELLETTVFSVKKLGWINCDRFLDDPTAGKAEIFVSNTLQNKLDFVDYSLVIPELNVRLAAFKDSSGRYTFTKNQEPYTKLPIGKNAVITAVSLQKDSLYYASEKIKITDGLAVNLPMKHINTKDLKDSLQVALK